MDRPLRLAPGLYLAAFGCAFLPLVEFRFNSGDTSVVLNGTDILSGLMTTIDLQNGQHLPFDLGPDLFATIAFAAMIAGFVVSLFPGWKNRIAAAVLAGIAALSLCWTRVNFINERNLRDFGALPQLQPAFTVLICVLGVAALSELPFALLLRVFRPLKSIRIPRYTVKRVESLKEDV